jgi:hypothetical protein
MNSPSLEMDQRIEDVAEDLSIAPSEAPEETDIDPALEYRALSTPAIIALALGILSPLAMVDWLLGIVPCVAIISGILALRQVRARGHEYTGGGLAIVGIVLAVGFWAAGAGRLSYIYVNELPEGYSRLSYSELQPQRGESTHQVPEDAQSWDGKKVLIKGYMYPGSKQHGITHFLLVRDKGDCCFGGDPKVTDRIQVVLSDLQGCEFSSGLYKVAGTFRISPPVKAVDASGAVFYHLDEATLR